MGVGMGTIFFSGRAYIKFKYDAQTCSHLWRRVRRLNTNSKWHSIVQLVFLHSSCVLSWISIHQVHGTYHYLAGSWRTNDNNWKMKIKYVSKNKINNIYSPSIDTRRVRQMGAGSDKFLFWRHVWLFFYWFRNKQQHHTDLGWSLTHCYIRKWYKLDNSLHNFIVASK